LERAHDTSGSYRPSRDQRRLFAALAEEIRNHRVEYFDAADWFGREFSLKAIDARKEADLTPEDKRFRKARKREGFVFHRRRDPSGYMERLLRATEDLIEIDDSALPKAARLEHYRRVILVGALMTDPDIHEEAPDLAKALAMDRSHWPTAEALTIGGDREIELNRWWARDQVFDPDFRGYQPFQPLLQRALGALDRERIKHTTDRGAAADPGKSESSNAPAREFQPAGFFPKKIHARLRHAAGPKRKSKRVETKSESGVVFYCVNDVRKWWPNDCPPRRAGT
jgi:hypothetical protein